MNIKSEFCTSERRKCFINKRQEMNGFEFNEQITFKNTYLNYSDISLKTVVVPFAIRIPNLINVTFELLLIIKSKLQQMP
jgi:hypothetical protein